MCIRDSLQTTVLNLPSCLHYRVAKTTGAGLLLLHYSRIRRRHLFKFLLPSHLLRDLPISLFSLDAYYKTRWGSLFASIIPIYSVHLSWHSTILAFTENIANSCPVSYTHLDVYKRQVDRRNNTIERTTVLLFTQYTQYCKVNILLRQLRNALEKAGVSSYRFSATPACGVR